MRSPWTAAIAAGAVAFAGPAPAVAAPEADGGGPQGRDLRNTDFGFLTLELAGSIVVFAVYSSAAGDPAKECGWCGTNGFDRGARDLFKMENSRAPATLSHVFSYGVVPAIALAGSIIPAFGPNGRAAYAGQDAFVLANAVVLSLGLSEGTKKAFDRQRPAFHYGRSNETEWEGSPGQEFLSFYSGDTAVAFTVASAGTTLAYLRGYETAPYVAIASGAFAVATGILRISADVHWATDVLTGAVVGTAVGFSLPYLLHPRAERNGPRATVLPVVTRRAVAVSAAVDF